MLFRSITSSSGTQVNLVGSSASDSGALQFVNSSQTRQWVIATNSTNFYVADGDFTHYAYLAQNPTGWTWASDRRIKEDITDLNYGIDTLKQIQPRRFKFKESGVETIGFIAQELKTVVPEAVDRDEVEFGDTDTNEERATKIMGVDQETLIPILVKALQEAVVEIEILKEKVATLESSE